MGNNKKLLKNSNHGQRRIYGLPTVVTLIVGIVVGSGIFYKGDDILVKTGGNIGYGVAVLALCAIGVIFGALALTEFSIRTQSNSGFTAYFDKFISRRAGSGFAWFQNYIYYPSLTVVVAWAAAIYTFVLFGRGDLAGKLYATIPLGIAYALSLIVINVISRKTGGIFQNITTYIKFAPLLLIAIAGLAIVATGTGAVVAKTTLDINNASTPEALASIEGAAALMEMKAKANVNMAWLSALPAVAFAYDGWVVATTIAPEVKNPRRNMRLGFIIGPIIIFLAYLIYLLGIHHLLGSEFIAIKGNGAITSGIAAIFSKGDINNTSTLVKSMSTIFNLLIVVAILGVDNGLIMGGIRMPQALAETGIIKDKDGKIAKIHPTKQVSIHSAIYFGILCLIWMAVHYFTQKTDLLAGSDVSEIAIVFSYLTYIVLYIKIFKMTRKGEIKNWFTGYVAPVLGIAGSLIIAVGAFIGKKRADILMILVFVLISGLSMFAGSKSYSAKLQNSIIEKLRLRVKELNPEADVEADEIDIEKKYDIDAE